MEAQEYRKTLGADSRALDALASVVASCPGRDRLSFGQTKEGREINGAST